MNVDEEIRKMVEEAIPMPKSCVFERNKADYRRKTLVEKINWLLSNFDKTIPNENTGLRVQED